MFMPKYSFCVRKNCPKRVNYAMRSRLEMAKIQDEDVSVGPTLSFSTLSETL